MKIFHEPNTDKRYGDIVHYRCNLNDVEIINRLFISACYFLKSLGVTAITAWAPNHAPLVKTLSNIGFVNKKSGPYFAVKIINPDYFYLYDNSKWIIMPSDATNF